MKVREIVGLLGEMPSEAEVVLEIGVGPYVPVSVVVMMPEDGKVCIGAKENGE